MIDDDFPFAWATDIHFDHLKPPRIKEFQEKLAAVSQTDIVITGDISNARTLETHLQALTIPNKRILFVLGNHDYYWGNVDDSRQRAKTFSRSDVTYLSSLPGAISLSDGSLLIGIDGYADARAGNFKGSNVWLNDYNLCSTFIGTRENVERVLNNLGNESAMELHEKIERTAEEFGLVGKRVFIATHAPPFKEAHWYNDKPGDKHWHPHFVNVALGTELRNIAKKWPLTKFIVVCGHTHGDARVTVTDNIECFVGAATYGQPKIQDVSTITRRQ